MHIPQENRGINSDIMYFFDDVDDLLLEVLDIMYELETLVLRVLSRDHEKDVRT